MLTEKQALALIESRFWEEMTTREIAVFQLFEPRLCLPFRVFHEALEKTLGRSVWTHELAQPEPLRKEIMGRRTPPTIEDIIALIPESKRYIIEV